MTNYTWTIDRINTLQQPVSGYVVEVFWTLTGESGQVKESIKESTNFKFDSTKQIIPFNELTENIVVDWVQNSLGELTVARYKQNVQSKLDSVLNPIVEPSEKDLPWSAT
jgi:hypothetical protein